MKILSLLFGLVALALTFIIPLYFFELLTFFVGTIGIGWVLSTILIRLAVIIFFIIFLKKIFSLIPRLNKMKLIFVVLIGIGPGFGIPFISAPIYQLDYGLMNDNLTINNPERLNEIAQKNVISESEYSLVGFFTTSCPHCMFACERLALNVQSGQKLPVHLFFPGTKEDTERFLSEHDGENFDYSLVDEDSSFIYLSGGSFSSICVLNQKG